MKPILITIEIIIAILIISGIWIYNSLVKSRNRVEASKSIINSYLKKRHSLVMALVEVVRGYAKHESSTLEKVINARGYSKTYSSSGELSLNSFYALSEEYPELKANDLFLNLLAKLENIENDLFSSRKAYNDVVLIYNDRIMLFPISIYAYILGFKKAGYIEIEDEEKNMTFSM